MTEAGVILVLEDEPLIGFALEDMLVELGFGVHLTTTIGEASRYLDEFAPLAAILDVNIHGNRSYDFSHALVIRQIPFLFATGYGDAEHPGALKMTPTLTKPYGLGELQAALASLLDPATGY